MAGDRHPFLTGRNDGHHAKPMTPEIMAQAIREAQGVEPGTARQSLHERTCPPLDVSGSAGGGDLREPQGQVHILKPKGVVHVIRPSRCHCLRRHGCAR
ncbi:MAG: hypothetical protein ACK4RN_15530 [Pseudorhodobacter sp.]